MRWKDAGWQVIGALSEQRRREIYATVRAANGPVTRDEVATACHISRELAAFHLDKLIDAGLLVATYARPAGRGGPGAGRPAKRYEPAPVDVDVSIPPRRYALIGRMLASLAAAPARHSPSEIAAAEGQAIGARLRPAKPVSAGRLRTLLRRALITLGYEPKQSQEKLLLSNCPFHELAQQERELVCSMNHALVDGVIRGIGAEQTFRADLEPEEGRCCVVVRHSVPETVKGSR